MATLLLSAVGAALGTGFGVFGTVAGRAIGALAGAALDQALFGTSRTVERGRLADLSVQASQEGASVPRIYGRMRVAGQVIWATRFTETVTSEKQGGKGGGSSVRTKTYSYTADFAVGLCEGPIARVGRVWANGAPLDLTRVTMRVHTGGESQEPDSLIEARQGTDAVPAYRGLAYVVFEGLPLGDFGNALPQLTFEVMRPVGRLERMIRAVTLIPGATEFGYEPAPVTRRPEEGVTETENAHTPVARSDVVAALDELEAVCPNLESVAVVVTWFGEDLRCGACAIRPRVENAGKRTAGRAWSVAGIGRGAAAVVSSVAGTPAFGGTPSDETVVALIRELRDRGLAVTFYPFVMMDVPEGNGLPDPYGSGLGQPAYPWRGRITCHPAPGRDGSPDGGAAVAGQVAQFVGTAAAADFSASGGAVVYSGPAEWSYRRMILHYARLCAIAGGVDSFLVGSEMRGLTALRTGFAAHPFVDALVVLAGDVKAMLGPGTKVSYAADWTEWANHRADDGSGDVTFHLDPLWASPDVDFVGIDAYFPLSDWRDGDHIDRTAAAAPTDRAYLAGNVAGGEDFDWYYASEADRRAQIRSPITDGAAGKPWVFRVKDLAGWWGNSHVNRPGGAETGAPTAWVPGAKPIRFTEVGCPAVDLGANEPNVFPDAVSSEGRSPRFSSGRRDDLMQRRYLEAVLGHFDPAAPDFVAARNPLSPLDGRRMVETARCHVWTFDARPFPQFPLYEDVWADGANWATGHWLNGRLGTAPLDDLVAAVLADHGIAEVDVDGLTGVVDGLAVPARGDARSVLEPLARLFRFDLVEREDRLAFRDRGGRTVATIGEEDLAAAGGEPLVDLRRAQDADVPKAVAVTFLDGSADYMQASAEARRAGEAVATALDVSAPISAPPVVMAGLAEALLKDLDAGRETVRLSLDPALVGIEPGDRLALSLPGLPSDVVVTRIELAEMPKIEARAFDPDIVARAAVSAVRRTSAGGATVFGAPRIAVLDVPGEGEGDRDHAPLLAAAARPWPGPLAVHRRSGTGFVFQQSLTLPATMGRLVAPLGPGRLWRLDETGAFEVSLLAGTLASVTAAQLLDGANVAAVECPDGSFEVLQFRDAALVGSRTYRLSGLLRGQLGTEDRMDAGHEAGATFVLLDGAPQRFDAGLAALGRSFSCRIGPEGRDVADAAMAEVDVVVGGRGLKPLAPVHLTARRLADGAVRFGWIRRTRVGGDGWDRLEVPLGEWAEAYEVDVRAGSAVRRRLAVTEPSALYPVEQQVADWGAPPAELTIAVHQISQSVGRGVAAVATFTF